MEFKPHLPCLEEQSEGGKEGEKESSLEGSPHLPVLLIEPISGVWLWMDSIQYPEETSQERGRRERAQDLSLSLELILQLLNLTFDLFEWRDGC
jgi:hypothetical protein